MAGRKTCHWMACVLGLLCFSGTGALEFQIRAADLDFNGADDEEDLPDMNYVRSQAEAGRPRSQTQLADFYVALSDFTNAVVWYQKAADQNHVPAQLTLAGCYISGRGVEKNPATAANWLRRAADQLEARANTNAPALTLAPIVLPSMTRPQTPTNAIPAPTPTATVTNRDFSPAPSISTVSVTTRTNAPHVRRINTLLAAEPDLQEIPTGLCAPSDSR